MLLALAGAAALILGGPAEPASSRPLITGVAGAGDYSTSSLHQVREAGARLVHIPVLWQSVAPAQRPVAWRPWDPSDPNYAWTQVDAAVTGAVRAGLAPVLLVDGAPAWAQQCRVAANATGTRLCDPDPADLSNFATAAASRFSGAFARLPRVRFWQGMNEPNLSLFFNPQFERGRPVSPGLYRDLINAFYASVKAVHKSNLVIAAGLGPIAVPRFTIGPMRFTRDLLCMRGHRNPRPTGGNCGGGVHFDIFDIHPYTTGGPNHRGKADDVQLGDLSKLQELLEAADRAGRIKGHFRRTPLWITEFSWDSRPPDPGGLKMSILSRWTAEALHRAWRAGVSRFFWFGLRDSARDGDRPYSDTLESGLYFRGATPGQDKPKRSMYAFRFPFVAYSRPRGFYFWGRTPNSRGGRVLIQVRDGGGWRRATVAKADRDGIFQGVVRGDYGRRKRGTVRARIRGKGAVPFSLRPVRGFYQPPFG